MRGLAACLVVVLGSGALVTLAACSDTTDAGSGGAGGSPAAAGSHSGGKTSSGGSTSNAGSATAGSGSDAAGSAGADSTCSFYSAECSACLGQKCGDKAAACTGSCSDGLLNTADCMCDPSKDSTKCLADFVAAEGDVAEQLANCFTVNCESACQ